MPKILAMRTKTRLTVSNLAISDIIIVSFCATIRNLSVNWVTPEQTPLSSRRIHLTPITYSWLIAVFDCIGCGVSSIGMISETKGQWQKDAVACG